MVLFLGLRFISLCLSCYNMRIRECIECSVSSFGTGLSTGMGQLIVAIVCTI